MAGEIGFDEGGVLKALATPVVHVEETRTNKSGRKTTKTVLEVTGAQIVALLIGWRLIAMFGVGSGDNIEKVKDVVDALKDEIFTKDKVYGQALTPAGRKQLIDEGHVEISPTKGIALKPCGKLKIALQQGKIDQATYDKLSERLNCDKATDWR